MDRTTKIAVVLCGAFLAVAALALDPPHDSSQGNGCSSCHIMHTSLGPSLTSKDTNFNLCDSCHKPPANTDFGFQWLSAQAVPGVSGYSHQWGVPATNRGANAPANPNMASHMDGPNIICSTCHDVHNNTAGARTGTQHIGGGPTGTTVTVPTSWAPNGNPGTKGTGTMTLATVTATAAGEGYRIALTAVSGTQITYAISHNRGATYSAGVTVTPGPTALNLDDGTNVQVSFPSSISLYRANDYWDFWVGYPMLQVASTDGAICLQCHQDRDMRWQDVEGGNAANPPLTGGTKSVVFGTTVFSHPVGQNLNANARNYDMTASTMRDANGVPQVTGDGNKTNDLVLGSTGVNCTTCHSPHNADSNSLSVDP